VLLFAGLFRHGLTSLWLGSSHRFRAVDELREWRKVGVDDQQLFDATTEKAIDRNLSVLDSHHGAGTSVNHIVLNAATVAEHHDNLLVTLSTDNRF